MNIFSLKIPTDFDDYEWEVESKGYFGNVELEIYGEKYFVSFYDSTRIMQEINDEISSRGLFFENNLIVLEKVTKSNMVASIEQLVRNSEINSLKPIK